jgi:hypothetical protein
VFIFPSLGQFNSLRSAFRLKGKSLDILSCTNYHNRAFLATVILSIITIFLSPLYSNCLFFLLALFGFTAFHFAAAKGGESSVHTPDKKTEQFSSLARAFLSCLLSVI